MSSYPPPLLPSSSQPIRHRPSVSALLWRRSRVGRNIISRYHYSFDVVVVSTSDFGGFWFLRALHSSTSHYTPRHLPSVYWLTRTGHPRAFFPPPLIIDTRLLLGQLSALAFIPQRRRPRFLLLSTTSLAREPPTPIPSRVYFILTRLLASSNLNLCHYISAPCCRILNRIAFRILPSSANLLYPGGRPTLSRPSRRCTTRRYRRARRKRRISRLQQNLDYMVGWRADLAYLYIITTPWLALARRCSVGSPGG